MTSTDPTRDGPPESVALAAVDRALDRAEASAPDPRLRELEALALALRDSAPAPRAEWVEELGIRVAEGFPRSGVLHLVRGPGRPHAPGGAAEASTGPRGGPHRPLHEPAR